MHYYKNTKKYYDIVISDIKMPNYDGIELVEAMYKINENQRVIILSARNEFNYLLPLVNLGIHQFFTKPIDYSNFFEDFDVNADIRNLKNIYGMGYKADNE